MPSTIIVRDSPIIRTARVVQLEGMFDLPPSERSKLTWEVNLPIEEREWNVGLIVGASGSGKTTIAREFFKDYIIDDFNWSKDKSVIDEFPKDMSIKEIIELLTSIGFSSPPAWLRNYHVLSNGEKFRVFIARALAERKEITVIDEFTSVVDRTVAKATSYTVQKYVRRYKRKFIAVSCHYDIIEWLMPDWIYDAGSKTFTWSDGVRRRPEIEIKVVRTDISAWEFFKNHHYLTSRLNRTARCFVAFWGNDPIAFCSVQAVVTAKPVWRISRMVVLPDYQGLGIGKFLITYIASLYATKGTVTVVMSHIGMLNALLRSPYWKLVRKGMFEDFPKWYKNSSFGRYTATFKYIGKPNFEDARAFGIID